MAEFEPKKNVVGYIVSAWPRLSETFILNEVLAVERLGVPLRIYSIKDPGPAPVHKKVGQVRAPMECLAEARHWKPAVGPSLRLLARRPVRYVRTLFEAARHRGADTRRRFLQAVCLADALDREPVTHLHAHFANAPAVVAMFVHQLTGIPYTFTAHAKDIYVKTPPKLLRAEIQRARAVVTCTEYNWRYLRTQAGPDSHAKVHRIYHGLDLSEFQFSLPGRSNGADPVILSVARLVEKKGLGDLIEAADILRRRGRGFRIEIIGDGPLRGALEERVAERGLQERIRLLGAQPHSAVRQAYARAAAFALPCVVASDGDRDGIPNVLLEAMASGVPVISTKVSGIPELIEPDREGMLIPPNSPEDLAKALERLLTDPELSGRLARAAREKIEKAFSVEENCRRLLDVFREAGANIQYAPSFEGMPRAA